jgi:hypothetical protein
MSVSLAVLLPVILLGIVGVFCFTGCALDSSGIPGQRPPNGGPPNGAPPNGGNGGPPNDAPFTKYSDTTVLANSAVVAYWPLSEDDNDFPDDNIPAVDRSPNGNDGQYIDQNTLAAIYPWPAVSVVSIESAAAPGNIAFAQDGIVPGDAVQPANDPAFTTPCVVVNGCYVNVPFNATINPTPSFTLEAWVRVDWDTNAPHAWRVVLDSRDFNPCTGFAIIAKADDNQPGVYHWMAVIGNGGSDAAGYTTATSNDPPITLNDPSMPSGVTYYLAVTYDGFSQTLTLYVDGEQRGESNPPAYIPNTTKPLWIGAGVPYIPLRPQAPGVLAGPLFPFVGAIQDVAIYSDALKPDVILTHYHNGKGTNP